MRVGDFINQLKNVNQVQKILQKTHEEIMLTHPVIEPQLQTVVAQNIIHFAILYCLNAQTTPNESDTMRLKKELPELEKKAVEYIMKELQKKDFRK